MTDRIEERLPFSKYLEADGLSASALKRIIQSPLHYKEPPPFDKSSAVIGRAAHTATLEVAQFLREYALYEGKVRRGKDFDKFAEANEGKTILNHREYDDAIRMSESVRRHPVANDLLSGGSAELSVFWTEPRSRRACRSRLDYVSPKGIVDLKTAQDVSPYRFGIAAARFHYAVQLAFYQDAYFCATGECLPVFLVAVEKRSPHDVCVFEVPNDVLMRGREQYQTAIETLELCESSGIWPGAYPDAVSLSVPSFEPIEDEAVLTMNGEVLNL